MNDHWHSCKTCAHIQTAPRVEQDCVDEDRYHRSPSCGQRPTCLYINSFVRNRWVWRECDSLTFTTSLQLRRIRCRYPWTLFPQSFPPLFHLFPHCVLSIPFKNPLCTFANFFIHVELRTRDTILTETQDLGISSSFTETNSLDKARYIEEHQEWWGKVYKNTYRGILLTGPGKLNGESHAYNASYVLPPAYSAWKHYLHVDFSDISVWWSPMNAAVGPSTTETLHSTTGGTGLEEERELYTSMWMSR